MPLTRNEQALVRKLGFDADIAEALKTNTSQALRRAERWSENYQLVAGNGIASDVRDGEEAERVIKALVPLLIPRGYRAFWSYRLAASGLKKGEEIVVLRTTDPYAVVHLRQTNGGNYDISNEDVVERLRAWESLCSFDVVGASIDWVALQFAKLPEKICDFAAEVYAFCPDSVEQGVGLNRESEHAEIFAAARRLCPDVRRLPHQGLNPDLMQSLPPEMAAQVQQMFNGLAKTSTSTEDGIRLLAESLRRTMYLFLWWD